MAKDPNKHLTKNLHMANKLMKRYTISYVTREIKIKTI